MQIVVTKLRIIEGYVWTWFSDSKHNNWNDISNL